MCPTAVRARHQSRFWKLKDTNAVSSTGTESTNFTNYLADLGDVDLVEELDEEKLREYLNSSLSTASEAQAENAIKTALLRVL